MKKSPPSAQLDVADKEPTLQLFLPAATKREITLRAAESGETIRVIVLRALDAYGIHVPKDSLVDRRKSP
ncbi:hypothetical protein RDV64_22780 (plasmid) [Acuticoccus sp. MNP-M23]|uniref:hypothetical protein n=1 Tax=Acuticoccus sp. MNP-M23 TaxID=3072793 RepID=UPI002815AEF7|nr:hypothetical protein [Acuticoccus sp. MNP-M23]WMS45215.1 hypothetical protein RDV64_22780 [Acuticoccus sp. MNP-M23]